MTISYDSLTAALQKASEEGGRYYNAMETQSQTMSGRIETLKDNWSQLLGTLTEGLTETEGKLVTAASGWVQRLQEAFETSGANGLMQAGGHIVDDIATGISDGIPSLATQAAGAVQNFCPVPAGQHRPDRGYGRTAADQFGKRDPEHGPHSCECCCTDSFFACCGALEQCG